LNFNWGGVAYADKVLVSKTAKPNLSTQTGIRWQFLGRSDFGIDFFGRGHDCRLAWLRKEAGLWS